MTEPIQVYRKTREIAYVEDGADVLMPICSIALSRVLLRLKEGVPQDHPLIVDTAAAVAYYEYSLRKSAERQGLRHFKAGDITVHTKADDELAAATSLKDEALVAASPILKDVGFAFERI